mgnify:CR=1 FL=1
MQAVQRERLDSTASVNYGITFEEAGGDECIAPDEITSKTTVHSKRKKKGANKSNQKLPIDLPWSTITYKRHEEILRFIYSAIPKKKKSDYEILDYGGYNGFCSYGICAKLGIPFSNAYIADLDPNGEWASGSHQGIEYDVYAGYGMDITDSLSGYIGYTIYRYSDKGSDAFDDDYDEYNYYYIPREIVSLISLVRRYNSK